MRTIVFTGALLLNLLLYGPAVAQGEASNWYFGSGAGLHFSEGNPQVLTDGAINEKTNLGTSTTVSDASGQLLFYSEGHTVWNRLHQPMPYGEITSRGYTASQVVAVPQPGNGRYYFIFRWYETGLLAVQVDMTLEGGLGNISSVFQLGTASLNGALSAVRHQNGEDIWVAAVDRNNTYYAYLVTREGVQRQPVVSQVGQISDNPGGSFGNFMKFSPDGRKLAASILTQKIIQILDFDAATGILSNPVWVPVTEAHDLEIYPCPLLLYASEDNNFYQYDLRGGSTEAILRSKTLIAQRPDAVADFTHPGLPSFQLGPDGKIYVGIQRHNYLHVIPHPEVVGTGCGFEARAIDLQGKYVYQGLTCFMRSYLMQDDVPEVQMPNVFTPNGDQSNEAFCPITLKNVTDAHLTIYNRWGRLLYQTKDAERGWNGNGHPAGIYYWSLFYRGRNRYECGKGYLIKGFVTLLR